MLGAKEKPVGVIQVESNWFHATRGTRAGQEEDQASFFPRLGSTCDPVVGVHPCPSSFSLSEPRSNTTQTTHETGTYTV